MEQVCLWRVNLFILVPIDIKNFGYNGEKKHSQTLSWYNKTLKVTK